MKGVKADYDNSCFTAAFAEADEARAAEVRQLAVKGQRVYATTRGAMAGASFYSGGVIASADGGATWRSPADGSLTCKGVTWIGADPLEPSRLWLGTAGNAAFTGVMEEKQ